MMGLAWVETIRFCTRRAIVALLLLGVLVTAALAFKTAWDTRPPSAQEQATAQAQAEAAAEDPTVISTMGECVRDPAAMIGPGATRADCAARFEPTPESLLERDQLDLITALDDEGARLAAFLIGLLVIAGATFAGADWASRSLTNQLIFEPRRVRLWAVKGLVAAVLGAAFVAVCLGGYWISLLMVAEARDLVVPDAALRMVGWHVVRALVLASAATLGAFALTMLFRHTVAALALLFVYAAGSEILATLVPVEGVARWTIGNNVFAWLKPDFEYVETTGQCAAYSECNPVRALSHLDAGLFLLALLVVAVVLSLVSFRRRDV